MGRELFSGDNEWLLHYPIRKVDAEYTTPLNVHFVGEEAFQGNPFIQRVTLTDITTIEPNAFKDCTALERCYVTEGLLSVQAGAFENATSLHTFIFPASLQTLTGSAFKNCPALDVVAFQGGVPTVEGSGVFSGSNYDQLIGTYPEAYAEVWENAVGANLMWQGLKMVRDTYYEAEAEGYYYQLYGGEVTITGTVEPLSGDVILPTYLDGYLVTGIGEGAFRTCVDLTSVTIPATYVRLGDFAFAYCSALQAVTFQGGPLTKGEFAEMPFPEGTTAIGYYPGETSTEWDKVLQDGKWYGLTMKSKGSLRVQVSALVAGNGTVSGSGMVLQGTSVTISATAGEDSVFMGWSGAVESAEATLTLTPEEDTILIATFVKKTLADRYASVNGSIPEEQVEQKVAETIAAQVASGEIFESEAMQAKIHEISMDTPMIEVVESGGQKSIDIAIEMKSTDNLASWSDVVMDNVTVEKRDGLIKVKVALPQDDKGAFYKFVVDEKNNR